MNTITRIVVGIAIAFVMAGCRGVPREYFIHRDVYAENNRESGNVYVHISNQGMQSVLNFDCQLKSNGTQHGGVKALIDFRSHDYVSFAFRVPPGAYWLEFTDGIRAEPWTVKFDAASQPIHVNLNYWLIPLHKKPSSPEEALLYQAELQVELSDQPPVVF